MNKLYYCLRQGSVVFKAIVVHIFVLVLFINMLHAQCPDFISVSTQAEIDNFAINYPNCTEIEGFIEIKYGNDITNLDGFGNIVSVGMFLSIEYCPILENVDGLTNLTYVGWSIIVEGCDIINDLSGFGNVVEYGGLHVSSCDSLLNLQGLENISPNATRFEIEFCESLSALTTFPNLSVVNGHFGIVYLPSLSSLDGLENLDSIGENVGIYHNALLTNIEALDNLKNVGGILTLSHNYSLESIHGFEGLRSIGSDLRIHNNTTLSTLTGLDSLNHIGGNLWIYENNALQTLSGIDNIEAESIEDLNITYNPQLSTCDVLSICNYLASPNGDIQIYVNAPGCNNSVEVIEACTVGVPEQETDLNLSTYPNPFTTSTTIEYEVYTRSNIQYTVYNSVGEAVAEGEDRNVMPGKHTITPTLHHLPAGLYYAVLRSGDGVSVVKMIKQ